MFSLHGVHAGVLKFAAQGPSTDGAPVVEPFMQERGDEKGIGHGRLPNPDADAVRLAAVPFKGWDERRGPDAREGGRRVERDVPRHALELVPRLADEDGAAEGFAAKEEGARLPLCLLEPARRGLSLFSLVAWKVEGRIEGEALSRAHAFHPSPFFSP